jgi:hypothetical protein
MHVNVEVPKAFSVRDDHEFFPFQHLLARMNPQLRVVQVATGVHMGGGCTVFWGLIYASTQKLTRRDVEAALAEAGFDFRHNGPLPKLDWVAADPVSA